MEMATELYIIIIGLVALIIMFSILFQFYPIFEGNEVSGDADKVANRLARLAQECWTKHRAGLDRDSEVCFSIDIKSNIIVNESLFTQYLKCEQLPNSVCDRISCDCTSRFYEDQDKVRWLVQNKNTTIKISYDGNAKKISVLDILATSDCFNSVQDSGEDGIDCGGDCVACTSDKATCEAEESNDGCISIPASDAEACCRERNLCCSAVTTTTMPPAGTTTTIASSLCDVDDIVNEVSKTNVYNYLSSIAERRRPAEGWGVDSTYNKETRDYIRDKLTEFGLDNVRIESFTYGSGSTGYNVIGELGSGTNEIVIGGHRDSVPAGPGAVDNGAGTVTVMEIARVFAANCKQFLDDNDYKIIFALFDSEEISTPDGRRLGSDAYVQQHGTANIDYMLNFDCPSGYVNDIALRNWVTNNKLLTATDECANRFALPIQKTTSDPCGYPCSDFAPFQQRGVKIASAFDIASSGQLCAGGRPVDGGVLHSSGDSLSIVDKDKLVWGSKFGTCLLRELVS